MPLKSALGVPVFCCLCLAALLSCGKKSTNQPDPHPTDSLIDTTGDTLIWPIDSLEPPPDSFYVENGPGLLIDDFERGVRDNLLFGFWYHFNDNPDGGLSRITNLDGLEQLNFARADSAFYSRRSLEISYSLDVGDYNFAPFVGFGTQLPTNVGDTAFDGTPYRALTFWHRGDAHWVRLETGGVLDQDWHQFRVSSSDHWQRVIIPLTAFQQEGWGEPVALDPLNLQALSWQIRGVHGRQGTLRIDNVYLALSSEELTP